MTERDFPAARIVGRAVIRGHLELTGTHLKFRPAGVAARVQGTPFSVQFTHLAAAGVTEPGRGMLGRRRPRLCVTLADGSEHYFAVPDAERVAEAVREQLGGAR